MSISCGKNTSALTEHRGRLLVEEANAIAAITQSVAKRVLVVEDNDLNRKLFCDVLKASGFAVEPCADGELAINAARAFDPDLVIMDIQLPNISGMELIGQLKRDLSLARIPVLAVTAYAGKGDEDKIRDVGAEGYLSKPVSIGPFMRVVRGLLDPKPAELITTG